MSSAKGNPMEDIEVVLSAIRRGDLAEVKRFLDNGGNIETIGGRFHSTLLTEACRFRATKVVDLLLDRGAAANARGGGFWTPLHYACSSDGSATAAAALVSKLLQHHAEVDATDFVTTAVFLGLRQGRTPLHLSCAKGFAAAALVLLEAGAEPNAADNDGRTPVHHAASYGRREAIAVLLSFGGDTSAVDRELDTPLHLATRGRHRLAMSLLEGAGADPEAANCWGLLAGTLAPGYKMNPRLQGDDAPTRQHRRDQRHREDAAAGACVACSAKKGFHYYFCKTEILRDLPDGLVLGPDGLPIAGGAGG